MLETSRLLSVGVFLIGVLAGASVCGAGRPAPSGPDHGGGASSSTAVPESGPAAPSTLPVTYRIGR